ncbi:amidohydrolase family protein, partial [Candidatus Bathyarchaeota archaeon]|nr:amidohydrolase family protein [Candidatus Bathyarchaeota archaeon]
PGLIDAHVHLGNIFKPDPATGFGSTNQTLALAAIYGVRYAKNLLLAGLTTVRDLGSAGDVAIRLREAVDARIVVVPRIVTCGRQICATGGHSDNLKHIKMSVADLENASLSVLADGVDEVIKAVRTQIRKGADCIKFLCTGGALEIIEGGLEALEYLHYSENEIRAFVDEANRWGKHVAVHATHSKAIEMCVRAGVRTIEHGIVLNDECARLMKEKNVYYVPTLYTYDMLGSPEYSAREYGGTKSLVEKMSIVNKDHETSFRKAVGAQVKVVMGTDVGIMADRPEIQGTNAHELVLMVRKGLAEMGAIMAATKNAAEAIGLGSKIGTIERGKLADVIVVDGNPLEDISILEQASRIKVVMKDGEIFKQEPA